MGASDLQGKFSSKWDKLKENFKKINSLLIDAEEAVDLYETELKEMIDCTITAKEVPCVQFKNLQVRG